MNKKIKIPTFLKWAGGKQRLLNQLEPSFPSKISRYFEPFLGAGSVFFYIKQRNSPKECSLSDMNVDLIETFKAVRDKPERLIEDLDEFKQNHSNDHYYTTRDEFNRGALRGVKRCAAFIYLNKTCFNGLYRVNTQNEFNVPIGRYENPEIYSIETILSASKLLQDVEISARDFLGIERNIKRNDFVYLDPCYDPLKKTSFVSYTTKKFREEDRIVLLEFIKRIDRLGAKFVLSNNDLPEIRKLYSEYWIREIIASRQINSKTDDRGQILELAISNTKW